MVLPGTRALQGRRFTAVVVPLWRRRQVTGSAKKGVLRGKVMGVCHPKEPGAWLSVGYSKREWEPRQAEPAFHP